MVSEREEQWCFAIADEICCWLIRLEETAEAETCIKD